jgi:hypothetical protein
VRRGARVDGGEQHPYLIAGEAGLLGHEAALRDL